MISALGVFLLALATPVQSPGDGPVAARRSPASRSVAPSAASFEQISVSAIQAFNDSHDDDAIRLFESGLKLKPDWDEGLWYLGVIYYEKKRFSEARDLLRHYLGQNPQQGPAWALLGLCDYQLREYDRALDHLQRGDSLGLQGREELVEAVSYHKVILLTRSGQFGAGQKAIVELYNQPSSETPSFLEIPVGLNVLEYQLLPEEVPAERRDLVKRMGAAVLARVGHHREEARNLLRDLVREHPREKGVHYQYGVLLLEEHDPAGVEEMQNVLAISPSHTEARVELAGYYLASSQLEKARSYVDEALKIEPLHPLAHLLKGQILNASGDASGAIKEFEQARQLAPEESRVLWALLRAYTAAGRREDAARVKAEIEKTEGTALLPK